MKKILLIEDNKDISKNIKDYLELHDFHVKQIFSGDMGLEEALNHTYDLILLDIGLPKTNGFLVCQKILQQKLTPIIFITARDNIDDKIFGLNMGANDYIVKPFDLRELLARIEIHLKNKTTQVSIYQYKDLLFDFENKIFKKNNKVIPITLKEADILKLIIENKDQITSRTYIIEQIWGNSGLFDSDAKLDVYISTLRKKLGKTFIKTIKGVGYQC